MGSVSELKVFLANGEAPVYLGWGSMVAHSPEHMTCLAVRSLKSLGKRGVILGGWAKLNANHVKGQKDEADLIAYIGQNVMFASSAPHEWLFPRCSAIVHHGGSGTTAASLRSGVPTVVTPCFADQFGNAEMVEASGCGVSTKQFHKLNVKGLTAALQKVLLNEKMKAKCIEARDQMREEDGLGNTVAIVDKFFVDDVDTGRWRQRFEDRQREVEELGRRFPKNKSFLGSYLCCGAGMPCKD